MAERTPLYMDINNVYSGDEFGLPYRDIMAEGVVGAFDLTVSAGTGNTVNVSAGACWVTGDTDTVNQPTYREINDAVVNKGISPDPTNPRIVRVVVQMVDATFAGATRNATITAIHGTPAASPAAPATPASALVLADVLVPANAASSAAYTFTDRRLQARPGAGTAQGIGIRPVTDFVQQLVNSAVDTTIFNKALLGLGTFGGIRVLTGGDLVNTTGANQAITLTTYLGNYDGSGVVAVARDAVTIPSGASSRAWRWELIFQSRGAVTDLLTSLEISDPAVPPVGNAGTFPGAKLIDGLSETQDIARDTTIPFYFALNFQLGVANAAYGITKRVAIIEYLN